MQTFVTVFQLPIMFLNMFGTIGAVIWLLVIGEWRWVITGILTIIFAPFLLGLVLLPGLALSAPAVFCAKRRIMIGVYFFSFLSSIYNYGVIAAWCGGVTYYFMREVNSHSFWPLLIWSYCVATSPWTYMAQKDGGSIPSFLAAFFVQAAFIVLMVVVGFGAELETDVQLFMLVLMIGIFFHMRFLAELNRMGMLHGD